MMKLSLTFLALAVATVQADLASQWNIDYLNAAKTGDVYTFSYSDIGDEMLIGNMRSYVFPNSDCVGTPIATNVAGTSSGLSTVSAMSMIYGPLSPNLGSVDVLVTMAAADAASSSMWTPDGGGQGGGSLGFCVRFGLFADGNEINYSETVVTLTITMDGGFAVENLAVAEKAKETSTQTQAYTVAASLCSTGAGAGNAFLQGSLICVQVAPASNDVVVTAITQFSWNNAPSGGTDTQTALPNTDGLTSYTSGTNTFTSILYAQFYESGFPVGGTGVATLGFARRRLGDGRSLQEELGAADAVQDFEIVADIVKSDDAPTALQTAGGATASFVVTIFGLVGAVLLA